MTFRKTIGGASAIALLSGLVTLAACSSGPGAPLTELQLPGVREPFAGGREPASGGRESAAPGSGSRSGGGGQVDDGDSNSSSDGGTGGPGQGPSTGSGGMEPGSPGSGGGSDICSAKSKCPNEKGNIFEACTQLLNTPCGAEATAYLTCYAQNEVCDGDGETDESATAQKCMQSAQAYATCAQKLVDAG